MGNYLDQIQVTALPASMEGCEECLKIGGSLSGWDQAALDSSWCPSPTELSNILAGLEPTPPPAEE
jgi:hypothetical protein